MDDEREESVVTLDIDVEALTWKDLEKLEETGSSLIRLREWLVEYAGVTDEDLENIPALRMHEIGAQLKAQLYDHLNPKNSARPTSSRSATTGRGRRK